MHPSETKRLTKVAKGLDALQDTLCAQAQHRARELGDYRGANPGLVDDACKREVAHLKRALGALCEVKVEVQMMVMGMGGVDHE